MDTNPSEKTNKLILELDMERKVVLSAESQEGVLYKRIFTSRSHDKARRGNLSDGGALLAGSHLPSKVAEVTALKVLLKFRDKASSCIISQ